MTDRHKPRRDYMRRLMWAKRHVDNMADVDNIVAGVANNGVDNKQPNPSESPPIAENANLPPRSFITEAESSSDNNPTNVSHTDKGLPIWYLTHVILPEGQKA